ncbi:Arsenate reductase glutaredoxin family protein [Ceratocystis platani]|uniref:Arsenate reductase glutaredoxin family protein n=1 Tax=Ceratocystis fimbriata f. sp. platani TaxID=88771 RepID=A0A0F8AWN2_CERFI|nr:Arsenate reductase glutaredoxin family protein [Ceratocystis platani]
MALKFAIYTCQPIPTAAATPDTSSTDTGLWSPLSITLLYTDTSALLVDCPASIKATHELAAWVRSQLPANSKLRYFVCSHAHGDHFLGFPVLKEHFPELEAYATQAVAEGIDEQQSSAMIENLWAKHVPELDLVVAGDIVYNGDCHQWLGEASNPAKREKWLMALEQIAGLRPKIVVPGHTFTPSLTPDEAIASEMIRSTANYIEGFAEEVKAAESEEDLFNRMRSRYSRWNLYLLAGSCKSGWANK